jgi:hypothetical protein
MRKALNRKGRKERRKVFVSKEKHSSFAFFASFAVPSVSVFGLAADAGAAPRPT